MTDRPRNIDVQRNPPKDDDGSGTFDGGGACDGAVLRSPAMAMADEPTTSLDEVLDRDDQVDRREGGRQTRRRRIDPPAVDLDDGDRNVARDRHCSHANRLGFYLEDEFHSWWRGERTGLGDPRSGWMAPGGSNGCIMLLLHSDANKK